MTKVAFSMSGSASLASQPTFLKTATTGPSEKAVTQQDMTDYRIELGDSRERLVQHPIYNLVNSPERMRTFMESHIWAVWGLPKSIESSSAASVVHNCSMDPNRGCRGAAVNQRNSS